MTGKAGATGSDLGSAHSLDVTAELAQTIEVTYAEPENKRIPAGSIIPEYPLSVQLIVNRRVHGNLPNPFSEATQIEFSLGQPCYVFVELTDLVGRRVARTVEKRFGAVVRQLSVSHHRAGQVRDSHRHQ